MDSNFLKKALLLMLLIVTIALVGWEIRLRKIGVQPTFDAGKVLWSDKRAMVYAPKDKATVFIGSSRIHFDLDIPTWESITGNKVVQLGIDGSSPMPVLTNLADDPDFKGNLIVDITEGLFFSTSPFNMEEPNNGINYYKDRTYAQKASFQINKLLESRLAFLDKENFSMNAYLAELRLKNRPKVFEMPIWPWQFSGASFDNQAIMYPIFVSDTNLQVTVRNIWAMFAKMEEKDIPMHGKQLDSFVNVVKVSVDKIKARGGNVFFTRTPSSGPYWIGEQMGFPRDKYYERILASTGCQGMHFQDYAVTKNMQCPEWSHLDQAQAIIYTKELIRVLREEKGWKL